MLYQGKQYDLCPFDIKTPTMDGAEALQTFEMELPDLVILDIMMPGLNGFQVLDLIRQRSNVPIITLTARGEA